MPSVSPAAVVPSAPSGPTAFGKYRLASRTLRTSSTVAKSARNGIRSVSSVSCLWIDVSSGRKGGASRLRQGNSRVVEPTTDRNGIVRVEDVARRRVVDDDRIANRPAELRKILLDPGLADQSPFTALEGTRKRTLT